MERDTFWRFFLRDPLTVVWRASASTVATLLLLGLLILVLLLAVLIPQAPPEIRDAPSAYGRWLSELRSSYGGPLDLWRSTGLVDIRASPGLRLLLGGISFSLILRTIDLAIRFGRLRTGAPLDEAEEARLEVDRPLDETAMSHLQARLAAQGFHVRKHALADGQPRLIAWRFPSRSAFAGLAYLGALLLLCASLINLRWGWSEAGLALSEQETLPVGHGTRLALEGREISVSADGGGAPAWQSLVTLSRQGHGSRQATLRPARPAYSAGMLIAQTSFGPAVTVTAKDRSGQPVELRPPSTRQADYLDRSIRFEATGDERYLYVPSHSLTVRLTYYEALPQRAETGPLIHVEAYRSGQARPTWDSFLDEGSSWTIDGVTYELQMGHYAVLRISFLPGLWPMLAGLLAVAVGALGLWAPTEDLRLTIAGSEAGTSVLVLSTASPRPLFWAPHRLDSERLARLLEP